MSLYAEPHLWLSPMVSETVQALKLCLCFHSCKGGGGDCIHPDSSLLVRVRLKKKGFIPSREGAEELRMFEAGMGINFLRPRSSGYAVR